MEIRIWTTDGEDRTFEQMTNILNNLIGGYAFYLTGEVTE